MVKPFCRHVGFETFLHDEGRIGAHHHQFAVRHVDDPHQAEDDGEPQRHDQEDGTEADAPKNCFDCGRPHTPALDTFDRFSGGLPDPLLLLGCSRFVRGLNQFL